MIYDFKSTPIKILKTTQYFIANGWSDDIFQALCKSKFKMFSYNRFLYTSLTSRHMLSLNARPLKAQRRPDQTRRPFARSLLVISLCTGDIIMQLQIGSIVLPSRQIDEGQRLHRLRNTNTVSINFTPAALAVVAVVFDSRPSV